MLPGISGSLIAGAFLEEVILPQLLTSRAPTPRELRALYQWWRRTERSLGPASGIRAVADIGAIPLAELVGFQVRQLEPYGNGFVGVLQTAATSLVVLRTTAWNADPGTAWRDTVRAGRYAGAR